MCDGEGFGFVIGVLLAISLFFYISLDDIDIDDKLGPYMCEQHGLEYEDYEYSFKDGNSITGMEFKIECKYPKNENKVDDGYLVVIN